MSKKIVFFDIDDTLLDYKKNLPLSTKKAIQQLQSAGILTVIATARPPFLFEKLREELNIHSYISFNGQYVVYENEVIYENPLENKRLDAIYQASKNHQIPMAFVNHAEMRATVNDHPYVKESILLENYPVVDQSFHRKENIYQALLYCKAGKEDEIKVDYPDFYFQRWHPVSCDIIPKGSSKAIGVEKIIEHARVNPENTYAFGDGINDLEMFEVVKNSIAMGNAIDVLKEKATFVTSDVDRDGIKKGLEHFRLI